MAGARAAQREVLAGLGVPLSGVVTSSGSGRSKHDRFTAAAMIYLLGQRSTATIPPWPRSATGTAATGGNPLLMRAGIDGTLNTSYGRYSTSPSSCARGLVYAKTGSLADAIALSGYAKGSDGTLEGVLGPRQQPPDGLLVAHHAPARRPDRGDGHRLLLRHKGALPRYFAGECPLVPFRGRAAPRSTGLRPRLGGTAAGRACGPAGPARTRR